MQGLHFLVEKRCEICNKPLYPTGMWVYKIRGPMKKMHWFCSWSCYKKGKEQYEIIENKNRKKRRFNWKYGDK